MWCLQAGLATIFVNHLIKYSKEWGGRPNQRMVLHQLEFWCKFVIHKREVIVNSSMLLYGLCALSEIIVFEDKSEKFGQRVHRIKEFSWQWVWGVQILECLSIKYGCLSIPGEWVVIKQHWSNFYSSHISHTRLHNFL